MGRPRKKKTYRPDRPRDLTTKEELILYLESNPEQEPPFYPALWDECVAAAEKVAREGNLSTGDGTDGEAMPTHVGNKSTNPVAHYFQRNHLPYNVKRANAYRASITHKDVRNMIDDAKKTAEDIGLIEPKDDEEQQYTEEFSDLPMDDISAWIMMFRPNERKYLNNRRASYYDQYEINEGADKSTLKRILSNEIELYRIDICRAKGQKVSITDEKKLQENLMSLYENMKWTKKQRSAKDEYAQNKFTVWLDELAKDGGFHPKEREYKKDDIDFLLETYIDAAREMMT